MRTLFVDVMRPIESRLLDPANRGNLGSSSVSLNRKFDKPMREFSIKSWDTLLREQVEEIRNEVHAGRVTAVCWFDGDQYGDITERVFIGEGNGVQLEFPMPYDNVFAPSWKIWDGVTLKTDWTMKEQAGIIVFASAPTSRITGIGKRKFRVIILENNESILDETQIYSQQSQDGDEGVYDVKPIILREVQAVSVA